MSRVQLETSLDELSYENMVNFYARELLMIAEGVSPKEVLGSCVRRKFRRLGVFKKPRGSNELSARAIKLLSTSKIKILSDR
jgi:hypothetical protein